jgi:hypothetical protein
MDQTLPTYHKLSQNQLLLCGADHWKARKDAERLAAGRFPCDAGFDSLSQLFLTEWLGE